ncbi:hypothetical protein EYF80_064412 [Liparis tanakae]|uniref:Uncharacterized protein n=1 Tax=Liparis tanakae TaxID=230148 RepID=A0A4Z2E9D1_9TELE|nr:hypothetical protein EYF80_064412 [Liparis tanakae]
MSSPLREDVLSSPGRCPVLSGKMSPPLRPAAPAETQCFDAQDEASGESRRDQPERERSLRPLPGS